MSSIGLYAKAIAAAVVATLMAAVSALADNQITPVEWTVIAGAFLIGLGAVWAVPNVPEVLRTYGKAATAGLVAVVAAVGVGLTDGALSQAEILTAVIALITGSGLTAIVPNAAESDGVSYVPERVDYDVADGAEPEGPAEEVPLDDLLRDERGI